MALYHHHITSIDATHLTATTTKGCALLGQPRCQPAMAFFRAQKPKKRSQKAAELEYVFQNCSTPFMALSRAEKNSNSGTNICVLDEQHIINLKIRPFIRIQFNKRTLCWRLAGELNAPKVRQAVLHTSLLILITALVQHLLSP